MTGRIYRLLTVLALPLFFAACSTTTLNSSWKSPTYQGKISKVYVIGVAKNDTNRRIFEDEFGKLLRAKGATSISSYTDLPSLEKVSKETIAAKMESNGAESVLIARLVGKRVEEVVTPGYVSGTSRPYNYPSHYGNWGGYYGSSYETVYQPPTVTQFEVATIEANLYDLKSGELIWAAQTDTTLEPDMQKLIGDFAKVVINNLQDQGLL